MEEITTNRIDTLTAEIVILKNQTAQNIIEIGKRLIEVKNSLPHGEFQNWLSNKVDFTYKTANRFMNVAKELGNMTTLSLLNSSKLYALLDVPSEERENFVIENDIANKSVRETERLIKEKKELQDINLDLLSQISTLNNHLEYQEKEIQVLNEKKQEVKIVEKIKEVIPESHNKFVQELKRQLSVAEKDYSALKKRVNELEPLEEQKEKIEKAYKELNELDRRNNQIRSEIEDSTRLLAFFKEFDNFINQKMMPVATTYNIRNLHNDFKEEFKIRLTNIENWIFAVKQKYQI